MTINYTTLLGLAKPVTGTESGVWGDIVNDQITSLLEDAISNAATISVTAGNVTLTDNNGSSDQSRMAILLVTGSPGVSRNIVAPSTSKWYIVKNSSNAEIVLKGSATTGVTIPAGAEAFAFWNGSDFELAAMIGPSSSTDNAVARFDGTTGKVVQNSAVTIADTTGDITTGGYVFTAAGAQTTPAYSTSGDTNTGMWFPAADTIAFSEGGTEVMRLDSSGNLGLGVTPSAWRSGARAFQLGATGYVSLNEQANGSTSLNFNCYESASNTWTYLVTGVAPTRYTQLSGAHNWFNASSGTAGNAISFTQAMTLDSSGNLGLGVTPSAWSTLKAMQFPVGSIASFDGGSGNRQINFFNNSYYDGSNFKYVATDTAQAYRMLAGEHRWFNASSGTAGNTISFTQAMTLDSGGRLLVGRTSSAGSVYSLELDNGTSDNRIGMYANATLTGGLLCATNELRMLGFGASTVLTFQTNGSERARITSGGEVYIAGTTDQGAYNLQVNGTGVWGAGAYVNGSDERLKDNIQTLNDGLAIVTQLRPVTFQYKQDYSKDQSVQPGFIAQELQQAMAGKDYLDGVVQSGPEYLNVAYQNLIPILTKAIQELKSELDTVKAELAALKGA